MVTIVGIPLLMLFVGISSDDSLCSQNMEESKMSIPPNAPAALKFDRSGISIDYNGRAILEAKIENVEDVIDINVINDDDDGRIDQVVKYVSRSKPLKLVGRIVASEQSFPCEAERRHGAPDIVRHSVGLSHSLLNRAIYDRESDWVLSIDFPSDVVIVPEDSTEDGITYRIEISGWDIIFRFRPRYYQKHRGLSYYKPWTYRVWDRSAAGWCSWFAFFTEVSEDQVKKTADILADVLVPYGLEYLQIDDGYQQTPTGLPETWLTPNERFPSGMEQLSDYIRERSLKPGIWTYTSFRQREFAQSNSKYFVRDENGDPAYGNWVGYVLDGSNSETMDDIIRPIYRGFASMGWQYYKVDALRHLRYEGYNSYQQYFENKNLNRVEVFRSVVSAIREEIGDENFLLGCWGIRPELIGLIDACRIGTDGFGYGGLAQYNSFNNVIWRNDPDHIELTPQEAYRSCMATSVTGSLFMLTDKPEVYQTELAEPAKRSLPILFTLPGQVYDVDPTRSDQLDRVDTETSGSGPRIFDADQTAVCDLFLLEINKQFESWTLLGRTGVDVQQIRLGDIGLDERQEYYVFEFWSKRMLGSFSESFRFGDIDPEFNCQLFCIRQRQSNPQVMATSRHITCGGFDLNDVIWADNRLSGKSKLVGGETYELYLTEPDGYVLKDVGCEGAEVAEKRKDGHLRVIQLKIDTNTEVCWAVRYDVR